MSDIPAKYSTLCTRQRDTIAALEAEKKRALDALAILGVPQGRARSVSNGIDVLSARFRKADMAQSVTIAALEAELAEALRWKAAVDDAGVVHWTLTKETENDPVKALGALLDSVSDIALDPAVSSDAAKLRDTYLHRAETAEHELAAERERREAAEKDAALYIRERDEWRQKHDFVAATARRYGVALDHIANNDDADCRLTGAQRIRLARDARRGEKD